MLATFPGRLRSLLRSSSPPHRTGGGTVFIWIAIIFSIIPIMSFSIATRIICLHELHCTPLFNIRPFISSGNTSSTTLIKFLVKLMCICTFEFYSDLYKADPLETIRWSCSNLFNGLRLWTRTILLAITFGSAGGIHLVCMSFSWDSCGIWGCIRTQDASCTMTSGQSRLDTVHLHRPSSSVFMQNGITSSASFSISHPITNVRNLREVRWSGIIYRFIYIIYQY